MLTTYSIYSETKKLPTTPETLLKRRKKQQRDRAKDAQAKLVARKVRILSS